MEQIHNNQEEQNPAEETNITAVVVILSIMAVMLFAIGYAFIS